MRAANIPELLQYNLHLTLLPLRPLILHNLAQHPEIFNPNFLLILQNNYSFSGTNAIEQTMPHELHIFLDMPAADFFAELILFDGALVHFYLQVYQINYTNIRYRLALFIATIIY